MGADELALAGVREATVKYHSCVALSLTRDSGTVSGGQFDWGGRLPKSNGGVQRFPQAGWKPAVAYKGVRELDCEADTPSRDESRA